MLTSLRIQNFRSLRNLTVEGLTRVSLLVGANNTGKTSVLEAAELALAGSSPSVIARAPSRRGEVNVRIEDGTGVVSRLEVAHLFFGHDLKLRPTFRIEASTPEPCFFEGRIEPYSPNAALTVAEQVASGLQLEAPLGLTVESDRFVAVSQPLSEQGLLPNAFQTARRLAVNPAAPPPRVHFIQTSAPPLMTIRELWDDVVLTPEEALVTQVLQIIEPGIERIAALAGSSGFSAATIFIKLKDSDQRIPLASMGEGINRLLVLGLNLVNAAGGYLLVDEIDTGLHHSVMVRMWRLVTEAAKRLNVQLLATTHSLDCVRALAALYEEQQGLRDIISVHRIERNAEHNVPYSADELLAAARHEMEIR
ncbi:MULTISPECIES: ATP/GTP-binding protein [unclassified Corallococcus]|uniref:AAA family ATPase n=1 Tax=Corallococcus TaxID=83461 RepID=UPI001CBDA4EC|nr:MULTISPECIES: AAA family ATPase [unclassified Corallococcus]MBZ4335409.1 AAA family ATPase [Corallococcus sp. AS-1-12]MBZ4375932.1 AAA family ATPase [Corallococcus sp. AS-1-6]